MNAPLFMVALSVHVITAVAGLGGILSVPVVLQPPIDLDRVVPSVRRLTRITSWALLVMLLSGILLDYASGGAFHDALWFRASFLLFLVLGGLNGWTQRALKRWTPPGGQSPLARVRRMAWIMCVILAVISVLMVLRPGA